MRESFLRAFFLASGRVSNVDIQGTDPTSDFAAMLNRLDSDLAALAEAQEAKAAEAAAAKAAKEAAEAAAKKAAAATETATEAGAGSPENLGSGSGPGVKINRVVGWVGPHDHAGDVTRRSGGTILAFIFLIVC